MEKKKTPAECARECIRAYHSAGESTDVQGSYTGTFRASTVNGISANRPCGSRRDADGLTPVQDADDL